MCSQCRYGLTISRVYSIVITSSVRAAEVPSTGTKFITSFVKIFQKYINFKGDIKTGTNTYIMVRTQTHRLLRKKSVLKCVRCFAMTKACKIFEPHYRFS